MDGIPTSPNTGVTGGDDGTAMLLDYRAGGRTAVIECRTADDDTVRSRPLALSASGERLAIGRADNLVTLTDTDEPEGPSARVSGVVLSATITPDGGTVVAGLDNGSLATWDGESDLPIEVEAHDGSVRQLAISPHGTKVASAAFESDTPLAELGGESEVRLWDLDDGQLTDAGRFDALDTTNGIAFSGDGDRVIVGGLGGYTVHRISTSNTQIVDLGPGNSVDSVAAHPERDVAAIGLSTGIGAAPSRLESRRWNRSGPELTHPAAVSGTRVH